MSKRFFLSPLAVVFSCLFALTPVSHVATAAAAGKSTSTPSVTNAPAAAAAAARALAEGTALLRRNRADLALPLVESALKLFTQANDKSGVAASHGALGDIYLRHGQYDTALEHFQRAADAFSAGNETANAALSYAKLGETYFLAGNEEAARAAFARIGEQKNASGTKVSGSPNNNSDTSGAVTFAAISAAVPGLLSCSSLKPNNDSSNKNPNNASAAAAVAAANNNPAERTLGHGPRGRNPSVRMDLRVVDQNGNPIQGVKSKLWSERSSNGFSCECSHTTDAFGSVLMDPIHITRTLQLKLEARGFEPQTIRVDPSQLDKPYRAVMLAKGAASGAAAASSAQNATQARDAASQGQNAANAAASCFDFYRLFVAYGMSELGLGRADFNKNQMDSSRAHYENVLAAADSNAPGGNLAAARLFRAVARTSLGDIALRQDRHADALKFYRQAVEIARQDGRAELTWGAQRGLGKTYWTMAAGGGEGEAALKNRNEAIKNYLAALSTIETLFAGSLRADDARSNFLATTKDVFDEAAGALAESALMNKPAALTPRNQALAHAPHVTDARPLEGQSLNYAAQAFRIVEQGRARSLLDLLGDTRAEVREGVPAALLERKAANMARQQEIANLLGGVALKGDAPKQTVPELEAELERLSVEFDSLENQIRTSSPRYAALVRTQPLTLAEVQQQLLDDSTVLLEYSLGTQQSYLFAATKSGLTIHRLPSRAAIERQVVELRQHLIPAGTRRAIAGINVESTRGLTLGSPSTATAKVGAYAASANALYETVVAPALASLGDKRLLIVPDGALNYVPFESLVTTTTQGADFSTLAYLVKTNEIVYAPSASVVAALRQGARRDAGRGMLLVADPVFDATDARLNSAAPGATRARESVMRMSLASALADVTSLKDSNLKLVRLDGTRSEAEEIAKLTRTSGGEADVWLDFDASEAKLHEGKLDGYRFLHFATHGLLNAERPQFTGLALSLVGQTDADGFLRVDEVFNLRLGSPLVMLSACETGLGKERRGEGVIGLTRAFMYAGAPTVGVSLWSVGDKSTAQLMPEFYRRLLAGGGAAGGAPAAMRASQLAMIAGKQYSAPFYWAPFVLVGDWR